MSFEEALSALERIVSHLEDGRVDLEQSISLYERGAQLRRHCETKLKAAEMRVEQIVQDADGQAQAVEAAKIDR
ncbi:MAG: exodeoxyribonuclease VII small subunit [Neomegalonema sp.]|nr:exodeoxyribonuclease VII small subunit [Neomegalonema sp.]